MSLVEKKAHGFSFSHCSSPLPESHLFGELGELKERSNTDDFFAEFVDSGVDKRRTYREIILIDDDGDYDNRLINPPEHPEVAFSSYPYSSSWEHVIREEDLELRLGLGATHVHLGNSNCGTNRLDFKFKDPNALKSGKASSSQYVCEFNEVKLKCAICMDTMKEETSTTCGHIFCGSCITNAIRVQRRCPTCREKLSLSNVHRIYLPGASS
ncbi:hypothetical protein OPV22_019970 [Ensete ventricosum]|uniref:RING-type domain-containing protein n=1 Tax=Ensete ventricosum TaxID=4639 RepID=A0AAV8QJ60_ENSVE|nr:hypothetical protein OPV22_019970 [Ensete ventricosum]